jgi:hypothetical protein
LGGDIPENFKAWSDARRRRNLQQARRGGALQPRNHGRNVASASLQTPRPDPQVRAYTLKKFDLFNQLGRQGRTPTPNVGAQFLSAVKDQNLGVSIGAGFLRKTQIIFRRPLISDGHAQI